MIQLLAFVFSGATTRANSLLTTNYFLLKLKNPPATVADVNSETRKFPFHSHGRSLTLNRRRGEGAPDIGNQSAFIMNPGIDAH